MLGAAMTREGGLFQEGAGKLFMQVAAFSNSIFPCGFVIFGREGQDDGGFTQLGATMYQEGLAPLLIHVPYFPTA